MGQTFPNTHDVTTVITKKSKITIKSWKTSKDTKATTETRRRTSKIIQNNHSHKYYSGETPPTKALEWFKNTYNGCKHVWV